MRKNNVYSSNFPERDMGTRIAHNLMSSNVLDYLEFSPDYSIIELAAKETQKLYLI